MGFFRKEREQSVARLKKAVDSGEITLGDLTRVANEGSTHDPASLTKPEKVLTKKQKARLNENNGR